MSGDPAGGVVYHPAWDAEIKADHGLKQKLVARLIQRHKESAKVGDGLMKSGSPGIANGFWSYSARCMRAAQAISGNKSTNPEDYTVIDLAWRAVAHPKQQEGQLT